MSRGLHMLGYDWMKGASAMTAALAEGLAEGVTHQRAGASAKDVTPASSKPPPGLPPGTVVSDKDVPPNEGEGWFTRRQLWGLPNWQIAGGAGVVGVIIYIIIRASSKARIA